jgi:hypothetical protein
MVSTLAITDALAKLMIAKGIITDEEFKAQLSTERANYLSCAETDALMMNRSKEDNSHCTYCAKLKSTSVEVTLMSDPSS